MASSPVTYPCAEESWSTLLCGASPSLEADSKNKETSEKNQNVEGYSLERVKSEKAAV